jgi:hypothetical protein
MQHLSEHTQSMHDFWTMGIGIAEAIATVPRLDDTCSAGLLPKHAAVTDTPG